MTEQETPPPSPSPAPAPSESAASRAREEIKNLSRWKKILLVSAAVLMVLGLVLKLTGAGESSPRESPTPKVATNQGTGGTKAKTHTAGLGNPLVDPRDQGTGSASESQAGDDAWSGGLFRLGFSFFAGFAIGYALRAFLKASVLAGGFALMFLMILSYVGVIEVNWDLVDGFFGDVVDRVKDESERFQTFVTGSLPSAGLGGLGLFAGFKKSI